MAKHIGIVACSAEGAAVPQLFIPKLIALYWRGLFPFERLVRFYDFSEINHAFADAKP